MTRIEVAPIRGPSYCVEFKENLTQEEIKRWMNDNIMSANECTYKSLEIQPENEISINTPLGMLTASASRDPNFPGIFVFLRQGRECSETDFVCVEADKEGARAYVWSNPSDDDWTDKFTWLKEKIKESI